MKVRHASHYPSTLPALALKVGTGRTSRGMDLSSMNVIPEPFCISITDSLYSIGDLKCKLTT